MLRALLAAFLRKRPSWLQAGMLRSRAARRPTTTLVRAAYAVVWLMAVTAAVGTLLGDGGMKVAVFAIVPIVLLAPPALVGIRALLRRRPEHDRAVPPVTS